VQRSITTDGVLNETGRAKNRMGLLATVRLSMIRFGGVSIGRRKGEDCCYVDMGPERLIDPVVHPELVLTPAVMLCVVLASPGTRV
jgi:hypothetical protein